MRKKASKQKQLRALQSRACSLCPPLSLSLQLPVSNLMKKYYRPQIETYHFRALNNLLHDVYSLEHVQMVEMQKSMYQGQSMKKCYSFGEIAGSIRGIIHKRVEKDFYGWVDFQTSHFSITNQYYMRRKQLVQNGRMMQKYLKNTSEMQSTGSGDDKNVRQYIRERIKKQLDQQRLVKPVIHQMTNSIIDLNRLTKNIESMVEKIADLSTIHPAPRKKASVKIINNEGKEEGLPFRLSSNCKEISVIRKIEEPFQANNIGNYQQTYGLQTIKPKQNRGKKINKLGLRSIQKLGGLDDTTRLPPQTPTPRMIHRFDYAEQETLQRRSKSKSKKNSLTGPLSPCSHSSSISSKNNSQKKSKSGRRR